MSSGFGAMSGCGVVVLFGTSVAMFVVFGAPVATFVVFGAPVATFVIFGTIPIVCNDTRGAAGGFGWSGH